jgi:glucose/arabinose dehydrogenase
MRILFTLCILLLVSTQSQSQTPRALRPDISISLVMKVNAEVTRLAFNSLDSSFYYSTANGNIYKVIIPHLSRARDTLVYTVSDHGVQYLQGMTFHDSCLYVSGNNDPWTSLTTGIIMRGKLSGGYVRDWDTVARTEPYPTSGWYDHFCSGLTLNPTGDTLLLCSGSRGDHGEVQTNGGVYPGLRNLPITTVILRIPAAATGLVIPNDSAALASMGLIFCSGIRNTFDFAYNAKGDLFGCENSGDRDMDDELNFLQSGKHYGFPWMMGGGYNPQQYPGYNPSADSLVNKIGWAWTIGSFHNDPTFPQKPAGLKLTLPCKNYGPDAAFLRDSATGTTYNAAAVSQPVYSFTPHRSPLGLTFDKDSILGGDYRGCGFVLSYTRGNPALPDSSVLLIPFKDTSEDLLMLVMEKDAASDTYSFHAHKIADQFNRPVDAVLRDTTMYVIEILYTGEQSLWRIDFPRYMKPVTGIDAHVAGGNVIAYPNPANNLLHIPIDQPSNKKIALSIFDASGRRVFTESKKYAQPRISVNTALFAPGLYHWEIAGSDVSGKGTFVVVHP